MTNYPTITISLLNIMFSIKELSVPNSDKQFGRINLQIKYLCIRVVTAAVVMVRVVKLDPQRTRIRMSLVYP